MNLLLHVYPFSRNSNDSTSFKTLNAALFALVMAVALAASPTQAANSLLNTNFDANNGNVVPTD